MNELGLIFIRGDKIALRRIRKVCKTVAVLSGAWELAARPHFAK